MLILTDGWDTGSDHGLADAIEACQSADTVVYTIRYRIAPPPFVASPIVFIRLRNRSARAKRDLEAISLHTGGLAFNSQKDEFLDILARIETDLRSQYILAYKPSAARKPEGYRKIEVTVPRPGLTVRARKGYYAEEH